MSREGADRSHPFESIFGGFRAVHFPAIRATLGEDSDINVFLLAAPALEMLRELRPDQGLGDAVDEFIALSHAAYLFWRDGEQTIPRDEAATRALCRPGPVTCDRPRLGVTATQYIQVAPRLIWGQLTDEESFEPLDGWFAIPGDLGLRVIACFGVHEQRPGVSIVVIEGPLPETVRRADGSPLFSPTMPGGAAAHLHAVSAPDELLLLGWRVSAGGEVAPWR